MNKRSSVQKGFVYGALTMAVAVGVTFATTRFIGVSDDGVLPIGTEVPGVESWQMVTIGGIVSFEIPSTCRLGNDPKWISLVCPTAENDTPTPEMNFVVEGDVVSLYRYENLETPYWNHIVASMKVIQPMARDITINVQK